MLEGHLVCQGESQSDPLGLARDERLTQVFGQFHRGSFARVADHNGHEIPFRHSFEANAPSGPGGLDRVEYQVQHGPRTPDSSAQSSIGIPLRLRSSKTLAC